MNQDKLNAIIKTKTISVPLYFLKMYQEFNLNVDEMVIIMFLYNQDGATFNPKLIADSLNLDLLKVMNIMSKLADKGLINVLTKENESKVKEEILDLSPLFSKIAIKLIDELNSVKDNDINVYQIIEEEFNRKLTPMECEMVDDWKRNNYSNTLIKEAVREATLNGVNSLRYIDKILYEWNKKGYKKKEDIQKISNSKEKVEIFNCDWLSSDEEL